MATHVDKQQDLVKEKEEAEEAFASEYFVGCDELKKAENFDDMGLNENLLRGIYGYGYEDPSAIQKQGIPLCMKGGDCICQSQSGTGKTATFTISMLQRIDCKSRTIQALILAPTRELADQIGNVATNLGNYLMKEEGLRIAVCRGGTSVRECRDKVSRGPQMVIGTPGRVLDMIMRRCLDPRKIRFFCLDEADEMLSQGFEQQVYEIFVKLPKQKQCILFSATFTKEVTDLTRKFMRKPTHLILKNDELTLDGIQQFYIKIGHERFKRDVLDDLYARLDISSCLIYCNTRRRIDEVQHFLTCRGHTVHAIHSDMNSEERKDILASFRSGNARILLATDLLARGIDVQQVSLVVNYDIPTKRENYIHRIGRCGRFGRKGVAINFVTKEDYRKIQDIEEFYKTEMVEMPEKFEEFLA